MPNGSCMVNSCGWPPLQYGLCLAPPSQSPPSALCWWFDHSPLAVLICMCSSSCNAALQYWSWLEPSARQLPYHGSLDVVGIKSLSLWQQASYTMSSLLHFPHLAYRAQYCITIVWLACCRDALSKLKAAIGDDAVPAGIPDIRVGSQAVGSDAADVVPAETPHGLPAGQCTSHYSPASCKELQPIWFQSKFTLVTCQTDLGQTLEFSCVTAVVHYSIIALLVSQLLLLTVFQLKACSVKVSKNNGHKHTFC